MTELTQGVKDAQAKFDAGMGADGAASPYFTTTLPVMFSGM